MKAIYIGLRDNDPYYKHQNKSRKLKGKGNVFNKGEEY